MKTQSWSPAFFVAAFALLFGAADFAQGAYCDPQWQVKSTTVPRIEGGGVFFDGHEFVVCNSEGILETSPDGESWTYRSRIFDSVPASGGDGGPPSGFFGNDHYVLLYPGVISTDLQHWEKLPLMPWAASFTQAGKYFFANGTYTAPYLYLSLDARHWYGIPRPNGQALTGVVYDETRGKYFAGLTDGSIGSSPDGMNWTWKPYSFGPVNTFACGLEHIVAMVGSYGIGWKLITSTDGETWSESLAPDLYRPMLRHGNGKFVILATMGSGSGGLVSDDGLHWTEIPIFGDSWTVDFAYGAGHWVAKASDGKLYSSTDGLDWSMADQGPNLYAINRVIRAGSPPLFVAISTERGDLRGGVWASSDGSSWSQTWNYPVSLYSIAWGSGRFVAVGSGNIIATSEDGLHWDVRHDPNMDNSLMGVAYGGGRFVAAAERDGLVFSSPDGITWDVASVNDLQHNEWAVSLAYGEGRFVLSSNRGLLRTSSDGRTWHTTRDGQNYQAIHVIYGDQGFIAGILADSQYSTYYVISPDGETWEKVSPAPGPFERCWYVNNHYIMSNYSHGTSGAGAGVLKVSEDGRHWTAQPESLPVYPWDLIGDGTTLWGVGCLTYETQSGAWSVFFQGEDCRPAVTGLSPALGPSEGGTEVSIAGSTLSDVTAVYFGGKPAASFKVVSDSLVTAVTPPHDHVETAVTVDSPLGRSTESGLDRFTFQSPSYYLEIMEVQWKGSLSKLLAIGYGFKNGCAVRINGTLVPKVKIIKGAGGKTNAVVTGGAALKAMLPKGRYVLITIDNPGEPTMTAMAIFAR